jgi:endo-1,4-beta-xylanase
MSLPMLSRRRAILSGAGLAGAIAAAAVVHRSPAAAVGRVPYGACARREPLADEPDYRAALRAHCQQLTPEGGLCWEFLRPTRQRFDFEAADNVLRFAEANGMTMRGHTLAWYGAMPDWTKEIATTREAERELTTHIERVVGRYRGKIKTWHVVNEPIDDPKGVVPGLRPSIWLRHLGERYIDLAFRLARQADPSAELLVNEYDIECADVDQPKKRQAFVKLIRDLLDRGVPLHGVGLQGHIRGQLQIDRDGLYRLVSELRSYGLAVHVTELDVIDDQLPAPAEVRDLVVAGRVHDFLEPIFAAVRPAVVATWGITDRHTWVPMWFKRKDGLPNRSLPFDRDYRAKPFWSVVDFFCGKAA